MSRQRRIAQLVHYLNYAPLLYTEASLAFKGQLCRRRSFSPSTWNVVTPNYVVINIGKRLRRRFSIQFRGEMEWILIVWNFNVTNSNKRMKWLQLLVIIPSFAYLNGTYSFYSINLLITLAKRNYPRSKSSHSSIQFILPNSKID